MRFSRIVVAAALVTFGASAPALAQYNPWGTQSYANRPDGKPANASGFFEANTTVFGWPNEQNKIGVFPKVGGKLEGSVWRAQGTTSTAIGDCSGSVGVGNFEAEVSAEIGINTTGPAGSRSYRGGPGATRPSGRFNSPIQNGRVNGGGKGPAGMIQCKAAIEANLISLQGQCETAVGTFAGSAKGVGGQAECGCNGCFAEAYWAKVGADYTTPAIGGCGFKASATVGGELMAGGAIGARKVGDAGAEIKFGPVGVKAGINIEEFDTAAMGDCLVNAGRAIRDRTVRIAQGAYNTGRSVVNGIASGAKKAGCFIASIFGGCKQETPAQATTPPSPTAGNSWTAGGTTFSGGAYNAPGISVSMGDLTAATAYNVYGGLSTGRLVNTDGAAAAGMARE